MRLPLAIALAAAAASALADGASAPPSRFQTQTQVRDAVAGVGYATAAQAQAMAQAQAQAAVEAKAGRLICIGQSLGQIVTNTTAETAFVFDQPCVVKGGSLAPGSALRVTQMGVYQSGLAQSVLPRIRLGPAASALTARPILMATPSAVSGLLNTNTDTPWGADTYHVVQASGSFLSAGRLYFATSATAALMVMIAPTATTSGVDLSVDNVLTASVQWSASMSADQIRATLIMVEVLRL